MSISVHEEANYSPCGLSLRTTAILCAATQIGITVFTSAFLNAHMEERSVILSILIAINLFSCLIACSFFILCLARRKFGTSYDLILHGYLLSMLLMALANFFALMYFPLSMMQSLHSLSTSSLVRSIVLTVCSALTLFYQFIQRNIVEQMLPHMQYNFK
uniref:7TM GPCR serpentine receptor class x (Srx) domain-containing protein n=1 Tax=Ascaris lumbricoides TaxID=6252 RepID=A0A0M3IJ47_ASCLU